MKNSLIFFLPHFIIGGAGNSIKNIALLLRRQKVKITIISLGKNHYRSELLKNKIKIIELNIKRTIFAIFYIKIILREESKKFILILYQILITQMF
jgi:glycosyltransferase involved in cell wall biosynthesis